MFKFTYRRPESHDYETQYIIAEDFPMAFDNLYFDKGDEIDIYACEKIAKEGIDLTISSKYVLSRQPEKGEATVIQGMKDYQ